MVGTIRTLLAFAALAGLAFAVGRTADSAQADHFACHSPNRGWGFDTYEYEDYPVAYGQLIELSVRGLVAPAPYSVGGEKVDVSYQGIETGPRDNRLPADKGKSIPSSLYKAMAWIEAAYANAQRDVPWGGTGPVLTSIDCGYGLGQITTGMGHLSAPPALDVRVPSARQAAIGTHPAFNVAEGIRILADKWNSAPNLRPISGNGDPAALEDWYYAVWSYNGFAFSNHPFNPNRDPLRGSVWHCGDPNAPGFGTFVRSDYTYSENVYGCLRYPPVPPGDDYPPPLASDGEPIDTTGPKFVPGDPGLVAGVGTCLNLRATASTSAAIVTCMQDGTLVTVLGGPETADGVTWWNVQVGGNVGWASDEFLVTISAPDPEAPVNPAGRMWTPQVFSMPAFAAPAVAAAMNPENFLSCQSADFGGGCAEMDYPTTIPELGVETHQETGNLASPSLVSYFLGSPVLDVIGTRDVSLTVTANRASAASITVRNTGTGIAPFRVRTSAAWLIVRRPNDPPGRVVDGSVALGSNMDVVVQKSPRVAVKGMDSLLEITVDPANIPSGALQGTVIIDSLYGPGTSVTITVKVGQSSGAGGTPTAPTFKSVLPGLVAEGLH